MARISALVNRNVFFDPVFQLPLHSVYRTSSNVYRHLIECFSSTMFETAVVEKFILSDVPCCSISSPVGIAVGDAIIKRPWSSCIQSLVGLNYSVIED